MPYFPNFDPADFVNLSGECHANMVKMDLSVWTGEDHLDCDGLTMIRGRGLSYDKDIDPIVVQALLFLKNVAKSLSPGAGLLSADIQ